MTVHDSVDECYNKLIEDADITALQEKISEDEQNNTEILERLRELQYFKHKEISSNITSAQEGQYEFFRELIKKKTGKYPEYVYPI